MDYEVIHKRETRKKFVVSFRFSDGSVQAAQMKRKGKLTEKKIDELAKMAYKEVRKK